MALSISSLGTASWNSTGTRTISISGIGAGDVLAFVVGAGDPATTVTNVTDNLGGTWSAGPSSPVSSGNMRGATFYKVCSGSETSISFDIGTGTTGQALAVKVTGFVGTATLEGSGEDEAQLSTASKSVTSGTASNTTASAVALAFFASDRADTVQDVSRSYSNSFTEIGFVTTSGSRAGAFAAGKVLSSTGSNTTTFTTGDTGDEMYGAILVFGDVTGGGGGVTVSVPAGSLTLTGNAPSVLVSDHKLIAVPSGTLLLTGQAPTVLVSDHKIVSVPAGSLVLTGYPPTVRVGADQIIQVPRGTLSLTGNAPSVLVTNNKFISVPSGALVLTGYAPTVIGSAVATKGGYQWTESDYKLRQRLKKLVLQQAYLEDDEEALAILLASIIRR